MGAVALGPFAFSADRLAAVVGVIAFSIVVTIVARRDERLNDWSYAVLVAAFLGARLGHVAINWESFSAEPMRVFAVWQGGFAPVAGGGAALAVTLAMLARHPKSLGLVVIPVAAGLFAANVAWQLAGPASNLAAPEQTFQTLNGKTLTLAGRDGPMVVNLWATWCPPCRREMPMMAEVAASVEGVDFVFANQAETSGTIGDFLAAEGLTIETILLDHMADLADHYAAPGLPATLFIDGNGTLVTSHLGEISRERLLQQIEALQ